MSNETPITYEIAFGALINYIQLSSDNLNIDELLENIRRLQTKLKQCPNSTHIFESYNQKYEYCKYCGLIKRKEPEQLDLWGNPLVASNR